MEGKKYKNAVLRPCLKKVSCVLFLFCALFSCACGKKKAPGQDGNAAELTASAGWQAPEVTQMPEVVGFDGVNPDTVQKKLSQLRGIIAARVGEQTVTMDTAMVLIYLMEVRGNFYAANYEPSFGSDYWEDYYDDSGRTNSDVFKEETIETMIRYAVLYDCAVKKGLGLTEAEKQENAAYVERIKAKMTAAEAERGGFTTESLIAACEWMMTAEKYYDRITEGLGITREMAAAGINPDKYKEYATEYLYLPVTYYDKNYNLCRESEDECAKRLARMENYFARVRAGADFSVLSEQDEQLQQKKRLFLEDGTGAESAYADAAKKLLDGEITGPVETEYGIYIIRMLDRNCKESYEKAVDTAYGLLQGEAFAAAYAVLLKDYEVEVNEDAWSGIVLGRTVICP